MNIKLCRVTNVYTTTGRVPILTTHDGRRIRYPDPKISRNDTVVVNLKDGKIVEIIKQRPGKIIMVTGGANRGRVGEILSIERHPGSFDVARLKDKAGNEFATRLANIFIIGTTYDTIRVSLPKGQGQKIGIIEGREQKLIAAETRKETQASKTRKQGRAKA